MHPVRVIHGSGQVLYLAPHTTVEEVLRHNPHHSLYQPGLNLYSGWRSNQMLALDTELQSGCVYFLFPLPRLFPIAPNLSSQSCRCYQLQKISTLANYQAASTRCRSSLIFYDSRKVEACLLASSRPSGSRWCLRSCCKNSKSKVSPESNLYSGGRHDDLMATPLYVPWRPRLGCISEEDEMAWKDVKRYCRKGGQSSCQQVSFVTCYVFTWPN